MENYKKIGYVSIYNDKDYVLRYVENAGEAEKILEFINSHENIKKLIIETETNYEFEPLLKHRKIKHIIHSGEYTASMAYDVTELSLFMADNLVLNGIYSYDLLAHNFTFENGTWVMFDFGALTFDKKKIKTQIRSTFKISFANFELLKHLSRKELKLFFLNRISHKHLIRMIPFFDWIKWFLKLEITLMIYSFKQYKTAYKYLIKVFNKYKNNFHKEIYQYNKLYDTNKDIYEIVDCLIKNKTDIFCIGKFAGNWALYSSENIVKTVYIDDYEFADKYYNYICKNSLKNIAIGVLQPLINDKNLPDNLKYRALYDEFTSERMHSEVVFFDFNEVFDNIYYSLDDFCDIIAGYSDSTLIIKTDFRLQEKIKTCFSSYFEQNNILYIDNSYIITFKNKIKNKMQNPVEYMNENRCRMAKEQSLSVIGILSDKKKY